MPLLVLRALVVEIFCCLACLATAQAATIDVGPEAAPGIRAIASLKASELGPDTTIRLHAGHYAASIVIPLTGMKEYPIIVEGASDGPIDIDGSIVLEHAAFIVLRRLHIAHATDAGIIVRHGSHEILVLENLIEHTKLGIWVGDGAGEGIRILRNSIGFSATDGIALDRVKNERGRDTEIGWNFIKDSGVHGIEVNANDIAIDNNYVSGSGRLSTGASGIHVFARSADDGFGNRNVIKGNHSFDNHDGSAQDGNGIQLDQWCNDNTVEFNTVENNDGAGISVFDAARADISRNEIHANMRDPGNSHRHKAELVFASDDEHGVDNTRGARASENVIAAANPHAAAILVDVPTSLHPPIFSNNSIDHKNNGPIARWAGHDVNSIAAWNALAPHRMPDHLPPP